MRRLLRRLLTLLVVLGLVAAVVYAFWPRPVAVDTALVERGDLLVTVTEDEGRSRVREPYVVSMPLAGRTERITLHAGDPVEAGRTLLTRIEPTDPSLLDVRALAHAEAAVRVAAAALEAAGSALERAREALRYASERVEVHKPMARTGVVPAEQLRTLQHQERLAERDVRSAELAVRVATFEKELAETALLHARPAEAGTTRPARVELRSPIDGRVLRVLQEDAATLAPGAALIELGDLRDVEVVVEALTRDAVRIRAGAEAELSGWGGTTPLLGRVRRVEPAAFTKVSALGVEEQRVLVLIDLETPLEQRAALGHAFRVEARILVDRREGALHVPSGALFRQGESWAVFGVRGGRAVLVPVRIGASDGRRTEILEGLAEGEVVIAYPSDKVRDGVAVAPRRDGPGS